MADTVEVSNHAPIIGRLCLSTNIATAVNRRGHLIYIINLIVYILLGPFRAECMESLRVMSSEHKPARELDVRKLGDLMAATHYYSLNKLPIVLSPNDQYKLYCATCSTVVKLKVSRS